MHATISAWTKAEICFLHQRLYNLVRAPLQSITSFVDFHEKYAYNVTVGLPEVLSDRNKDYHDILPVF